MLCASIRRDFGFGGGLTFSLQMQSAKGFALY